MICMLSSPCEECFCVIDTLEAFRWGVINHWLSSDINFFVNATVSSLSADWKIWEALFISTLLTPPSWGNGAGFVQAINATAMPKVVICHTSVITNHYMESAPNFPSLGWCCDCVLRFLWSCSVVPFPHKNSHAHMPWFPVICVAVFAYSCLYHHLWLLFCKAMLSKSDP